MSPVPGSFVFMKNSTKTIGIYCRISRLKGEGKDKSINDQKLLGIAQADKLGYHYELYIDEGLSAASDDINDRPEFKRLLDDMKEGKLHAIYAYDQSRFERNPQIHHVFVGTVKEHIKEYYTEIDGLVDLNDPQVVLMANMVSIFNQYHVTMTKHKVKSVLNRNAREGKAHGIIAYGYSKDKSGYLIIDDEESKVVQRIYDLSLKGFGTRAIANQLNQDGVPTRYNKIGIGVITVKNKYTGVPNSIPKASVKWAQNTIRTILRNPWYKGERVYKGEPIRVPAIISQQKWDKVQENLPKRTNSSTVKYDYLMKGKLRCGRCGRNYYGRSRKDKSDHVYMCSSRRIKDGNCGNRGINIDKLDEFIWYRIINSSLFLKVLKRDFSFNENKGRTIEIKIVQKKNEIAKMDQVRKRLITAYSNGVFEEEDLQKQLGELTAQRNKIYADLEILESQMKAFKHSTEILSSYHGFQQKLTHFRENLTFEEKQSIVDMFIENVVIAYNDDLKGYDLDITYVIHPSEFDKEYPEDYGNAKLCFMERSSTKSNITSEMVWCGFRKGLLTTRPASLPILPATL